MLLTSITVSGLQSLINTATTIISNDGLRFNPAKTVCTTFGPCAYTKEPVWNIDGVQLHNDRHVKYRGATLGISGSKTRTKEMVSAAQRSFYALQVVGLHKDEVDPHTAAYLHKMVIAPTLTYGCNAIYMRKNDLHD